MNSLMIRIMILKPIGYFFKMLGQILWRVIVASCLGGVLYVLILALRGEYNSFLYKILGFSVAETMQVGSAIDSFNLYRDFVTTVTGMLALIVGAIGIGSYVSFKKFKEEEKKITDRRKQLEMHLKIEEAKLVKGSDDLGSMTVVRIYNEAEELYNNYPLLYILRGEEYYLIGKDHYHAAKTEFKRALEEDPISSRGWYGLGQTLYKLALKDKEFDSPQDIDLTGVDISQLKLRDFEDEATGNDKIEEAIECMQNAFSYGFDEALVKYEIGRMYETIKKESKALKMYKEAFDVNQSNYTTGFYYCSLWVRMKINILNEDHIKFNEVVDILKETTYQNLYAGPLAYALLWFLYAKTGDDKKAKKMVGEIRPYAVRELFTINDCVEGVCSPSTV